MIGLISINHNKAPLKIREKFSFTDSEIPECYRFILSKIFLDGVFILSTCNRTEIYFEKENCEHEYDYIKNKVLNSLVLFKSFDQDIVPYIFFAYNTEASHHFFSVLSGLKSLVFGEYQIVSQIKEAYYLSQGHQMLSPTLEKMIHKAFEAGKAVRTDTSISKGATSVSSAAVEISVKKFSEPSKIKVLVVGTGETGQLLIESLRKKTCKNISIANRTYQKAIEIAKPFNAKVIAYKDIFDKMDDVDMLVFSTSAQEPILTETKMKALMKQREGKAILVIDVGVPRNVEPGVENIDGVELFNIDKLQEVINKNNSSKKGQLKKANAIIETKVNEFEDWLKTNQLKKTFALINASFSQINKAQLERYKDNEAVSEITKYGDVLSKKYSKMIIKKLRIANQSGIHPEALKLIEEIFNFNKN